MNSLFGKVSGLDLGRCEKALREDRYQAVH
jgi:hypothetical protein